MGPPSENPIVKPASWFLENQRQWFYTECQGEIHPIGVSKTEGIYFPYHDYIDPLIIQAEADLTDPRELDGCHKFLACWQEDRAKRANQCIVESSLAGTSRVHFYLGELPSPLRFWTLSQTAFCYVKWLQSLNAAIRVRWDKDRYF